MGAASAGNASTASAAAAPVPERQCQRPRAGSPATVSPRAPVYPRMSVADGMCHTPVTSAPFAGIRSLVRSNRVSEPGVGPAVCSAAMVIGTIGSLVGHVFSSSRDSVGSGRAPGGVWLSRGDWARAPLQWSRRGVGRVCDGALRATPGCSASAYHGFGPLGATRVSRPTPATSVRSDSSL